MRCHEAKIRPVRTRVLPPLASWMQTTGAHDVRATSPARKRCQSTAVHASGCLSLLLYFLLYSVDAQASVTLPATFRFQAGYIPSWHGSCESYAPSQVAGACRWLLLLLSGPGQDALPGCPPEFAW